MIDTHVFLPQHASVFPDSAPLLKSPPEVLCEIADSIEAPQDKVSFAIANKYIYYATRERHIAASATLMASNAITRADYDVVLARLTQEVPDKALWADPVSELIRQTQSSYPNFTSMKLPTLADAIEEMPLKARDTPLQSLHEKLATQLGSLQHTQASQKALALTKETYEKPPAPILLAYSNRQWPISLSEIEYLAEASMAHSSSNQSKILSNLARRHAHNLYPKEDKKSGIRLILQAAGAKKIVAEDRQPICSELRETLRAGSIRYGDFFDDVKEELARLEAGQDSTSQLLMVG